MPFKGSMLSASHKWRTSGKMRSASLKRQTSDQLEKQTLHKSSGQHFWRHPKRTPSRQLFVSLVSTHSTATESSQHKWRLSLPTSIHRALPLQQSSLVRAVMDVFWYIWSTMQCRKQRGDGWIRSSNRPTDSYKSQASTQLHTQSINVHPNAGWGHSAMHDLVKSAYMHRIEIQYHDSRALICVVIHIQSSQSDCIDVWGSENQLMQGKSCA